MPGIVDQLQRDAADPAVSVTTLLRRAKIAAAKLGLSQVEIWMEHELKGYPDGDVPDYRRISGEPRAYNPYRGWIPVVTDNADFLEMLSTNHCFQSISEIEEVISRSEGGFATIPFGPEKTILMNKLGQVTWSKYDVKFSITSLTNMVDNVRNAILDWSLGLEKAGISGATFAFTSHDKEVARGVPMTTINVGNIQSMVGAIGTHNTQGAISTGTIAAGLTRLAQQVREHADTLAAAGADGDALSRLTDEMEKEASKSEPNSGRLTSLLHDLRNVVSGAAGNLVASGVLHEIGRFLN